MENVKYIGKCLLIEENEAEKGKMKRILVIGDLHLGYEEALNNSGVMILRKMFDEGIEYLERVFDKVGKVDKIILLGDLKHEFGIILKQERDDLERLIEFLETKSGEIVIIRGNHDKIIDFMLIGNKIEIKDYYIYGKWCFLHGDKDFLKTEDKEIKNWVMGHLHPAIKLSDGAKMEKYKCFLEGEYKGKEIIIVPSFSEASEGSDPRDEENNLAWDFNLEKFNVKVVDGLETRDFGKLGKIN